MTKKNEQLQEMHDDFVSKNNKYERISDRIWNSLFFYAGDSFITMNKKEREQFFRTYIVHDELTQGTREQYKRAFNNITNFIEGKPRKIIDDCECKYKTNLVHNPKNKNNKTNDSDSDKLYKRMASLIESRDLRKQKIKNLEQQLEDEKKGLSYDEFNIAEIEDILNRMRNVLSSC